MMNKKKVFAILIYFYKRIIVGYLYTPQRLSIPIINGTILLIEECRTLFCSSLILFLANDENKLYSFEAN